MIKKTCLVILILIMIFASTNSSFSDTINNLEKLNTVLKQGDIQNIKFLTRYSDEIKLWDKPQEADIRFYKNSYGIDYENSQVDKTRKITEIWCSISKDDLKKEYKKHGASIIKSDKWRNKITLRINREIFPSSTLAETWIKRDIKRRNLKKDITSEQIFNQTCWSNRDEFHNNKKDFEICFVDKEIMVHIEINVTHLSCLELNEKYVDNILKVINSRFNER